MVDSGILENNKKMHPKIIKNQTKDRPKIIPKPSKNASRSLLGSKLAPIIQIVVYFLLLGTILESLGALLGRSWALLEDSWKALEGS